MSEELTFQINSPGEHVIRIGQAHNVHDLKPVSIIGDIHSPRKWVENRFKPAEKLPYGVNAIFYHKKGKICLTVDEDSVFATQIVGALKKNEFLSNLRINSESYYTLKDLVSTFRFAGRYFVSSKDHKDFLSTLNSFNAKIQKDLVSNSNRATGSFENSSKVEISGSLKEKSFTLNVPIYEGFDKQQFLINIEVEEVSGSPVFYLISDDIDEILESEQNRIFQESEQVFNDYNIVTIHNYD